MKNLTIVINGLEYVAKSNQNNDLFYANRELLLNDEITKLRNEINELEQTVDQQVGEIQGMSFIIKGLEDQIAELEEENGLTMSKFNELEEALNDINYITSRFI
jgi:chromosome segregation ATPase